MLQKIGLARAMFLSLFASITRLSIDLAVMIVSGFKIKAYFVVVFSKAILFALPKPQLCSSKINSKPES